jgi:hypothetical protein
MIVLKRIHLLILLKRTSLLLISMLTFIKFVVRLGGVVGEEISTCLDYFPLVQHQVLVKCSVVF